MRVDALQEAIIHIGTEWQASKVKLALSCHANYRWICARPLKVNKNDYDLEKIKNLISGVWNSSDISLDLGKLHNQIQTMEHSRLNFTAAGVGSDFFHSFSNFISGKNILSTIFSYAAVATLILLLIIILPCIVRILWHSIQKLATELHLVVLRNKKGGDAWSQDRRCWEPEQISPMTRSCGETWRARRVRSQGVLSLSINPKTKICLFTVFYTILLWHYRGLSPTTFLWKKLT